MSMLANSNAIESGGYNIDRSLRFRSSASAYLSRTPASAGNRQTWTWSGWVKCGTVAPSGILFQSPGAGGFGVEGFITFSSGNLAVNFDYNGGSRWQLVTSAVYRDPSAWYHIVCVADTTNATSSNRLKIYVNGTQVTAFSTANYPTQNANGTLNQAYIHALCARTNPSEYFDGYLAEVNFIDGQALTPSSFGETSTETGVWVPKKYTGTYGTNGFYLDFKDNTSATTLAYDKSGNGNNWTPNNISTTAGATYDSMTDVPTLTSATAANYCVLNPLDKYSSITASDGNLTVSGIGEIRGSMQIPNTGKWYAEFTMPGTNNTVEAACGIANSAPLAVGGVTATNVWWIYGSNQRGVTRNGAWSSYTAGGWTAGDIAQVAVDLANNQVWLGWNNQWYNASGALTGNPSAGTGATVTGLATDNYFFVADVYGVTSNANFGQRPFSYTPPTGFKALNTFNLPDPTIKKPNQYMDATTYTGNGSTQTITNAAGFQPDLVWNKSRSVAASHELYDSVRGATNRICSNLTQAEDVVSGVTSFNSTGYSLGSGTGSNSNGNTFVGWQWKKGAMSGFDIVTYTGTGVNNRTVSHNLGVAPAMIIVKDRTSAYNWDIYHQSLGISATLTFTSNATRNLNAFGTNAPTSSVFYTQDSFTNTNGDAYVAYLFAEIAGFSKFGSYTGNGSTDGPFVYCGFRPKYVMVKVTSSAGYWMVYDSARDTYNVVGNFVKPSAADAEVSVPPLLDFVSNGFKLRGTNGVQNDSGQTYIYAAFAENPFKYSLAR